MKNARAFFVVLFAALLVGCAAVPAERTPSSVSDAGNIYLCGEEHSNPNHLIRELDLWQVYYHKEGMRHLFVELPYYTAQYLNQWMQAGDDAILEQLFKDNEGTAAASKVSENFYRIIKSSCPETVFHGTDVGHQYDTTGQRYLAQADLTPEQRSLAEETMEQGKQYYAKQDDVYRENTMTENFMREFDALDGQSVMGIYGSAHTDPAAMDYETGTVPCMANQLAGRYGERLQSLDMAAETIRTEPERMDTIEIASKQYRAAYFGRIIRSADGSGLPYLDFWRIEDAGEDFAKAPGNGDNLPYYNYPCPVKEGDVFVIDVVQVDGSTLRLYHRAAGGIYQGDPATEGFAPE